MPDLRDSKTTFISNGHASKKSTAMALIAQIKKTLAPNAI